MVDLRPYFITTERPYKEGAVEVFSQAFKGAAEGETATLTITALGLYEAEINGKKVGDRVFTPGFTYYPKHLNVQTYDVTDLLKEENTLKVYLAQGWYSGRFTYENTNKIYGENPAASWVLTVGDKIYTSLDDVQAQPSPYAYAGFYDGEVYDEALENEVYPPAPFKGELPEKLEETILSVKLQEEIKVQSVTVRGDETILDFGQNFAGIITIDPSKMATDYVKIRHGEILNEDGSLYTINLRKAKATTEYHKGEGIYTPRFTYMGFRYVELTGCPYEEGMLKAYALHSEMEKTGDFHSENPLVDRLYLNQVWGQKSNYVEVPTDCPQRDERMGYTGDGQVFACTGAYNFDTRKFWKKYLRDIRDSQEDNTEGYVAPTVPTPPGKSGVGMLSMLGWGNCVTIVPEMLYQHFGDISFLKEQYESMKTFVACELRHMGDTHLWLGPSLGDWLMMGKDTGWMAVHNGPVSNAFVVNDLRIMRDTAALFGKKEEEKFYAEELEKSRAAYIAHFIKEDGTMTDDYQGAYIMALKHVVPKTDALWAKLYRKLLERIYTQGMQTGFFATEHLLPMLAENGQEGLAIHLLLQDHCPGWMYQVKRGATTSWERWDSLRPDGTVNETSMSGDNMVSFNHYSFGSVGLFMYRHILGIREAAPGFSKVLLQPIAAKEIGSASGSFKTDHGTITSAWKVEGDTVVYDFTTPVEAEIVLGDGSRYQVAPGTYHYTVSSSCLPVVPELDYDAIEEREKREAEPAPVVEEAEAPADGKLSINSTIGQILGDPRGKAIVDQMLPGFSENEQIKPAYGMTFPKLAGMMHLPDVLLTTMAQMLQDLE